MLHRRIRGKLERIGLPNPFMTANVAGDESADRFEVAAQDHKTAITQIIDWLQQRLGANSIAAIGHRVVHGGTRFGNAEPITPQVIQELHIPSHTAPETPGSIHEGGELGYSLAHAFGAAFDNPDLLVCCVIGDGEAETGPLATSWHSNKFLNPVHDGAVLPILHLNGYKIAGPTVLARLVWESVNPFISPVEIAFNQTILVAVIGLIVNGASVIILSHEDRDHHEDHAHDDKHHAHHHDRHDHNLRAAYLHVLADALTSILAIVALLAGKFYGLVWMDPLMGIVGAVLVGRWSLGLIRTTSSVLLDRQGPPAIEEAIRKSIEERDDNRVADLHVWSIGPNIHAVVLTIVTHEPKSPDHYKQMIPAAMGLEHTTVEVHRCEDSDPGEVDLLQNGNPSPNPRRENFRDRSQTGFDTKQR